MNYRLIYMKHAQRDAKKIQGTPLARKIQSLLAIVQKNPLQTPSPFEKLRGDFEGAYSRRINIHHRLVYQILQKQKVVKILRMWTHYE